MYFHVFSILYLYNFFQFYMLAYSFPKGLGLMMITLLVGRCLTIYTNLQANTCFVEKGVPACQSSIKTCTDNPQCQQQLGRFQKCSFGITQSQIFNGYCFRKWNQQAVLTKQMISCLTLQCDLEYNSLIGLQQLYQCTQKVVVENFWECNQQCTQALHKIRDNFVKQKIQDLLNNPLGNDIADQLISSIKKACIQDRVQISQQVYQNITQNNQQNQIQEDKIEEETRKQNAQIPQQL